jgi:general secretion pathway protein F
MTRVSKAPSNFLYIAASNTGGRKVGLRQAENERLLRDALKRDRLLLIRARRLPAWLASDVGLMKLKDRAEMNTQLAQLLGRGVPLVEALEVTASTVTPRERARVTKMRDLVSQGSSLAVACEKTGASDAVTSAVYRAAERTGDLPGAAGQLATTARRQLAVGSKAVTLMVYPLFVLIISVSMVSVLLAFVVPMIGRTLVEAGVELNPFSKIVFGAGFAFRNNLLIVGVGFVLLVIGVVLMRSVIGSFIAGIARKTPLFAPLILAQESARFFSVMAAMTRSGVPIADALGVANLTIGLPQLRTQLTKLRTRLIEGGVLRHLIDDVDALPMATRRLLIAAERSGDLEAAFTALAEDMAVEVDQRASRLLAAMEPILIVCLFGIVGSMLLAILFPILTAAGGIE